MEVDRSMMDEVQKQMYLFPESGGKKEGFPGRNTPIKWEGSDKGKIPVNTDDTGKNSTE